MTANKAKKSGSAMTEIALVLPPLLLMIMGVADFARVFYAAIEVANAASAGALAGSYKVPNARNTTLISNAATNEAPDLSGVTVSSSRACNCANGTSVSCGGTCLTGNVQMYLTVTVSKTFNTLARYPKVPSQMVLSRTTKIRVQ